jgi:hypothetical protein
MNHPLTKGSSILSDCWLGKTVESYLDPLGTLSKLKVLNVSNNFVGNTVLDMTESVMRALGDTITDFTFGSKMQRTWPVSVTTHLQDLHRLEVTGLHPSFTIIPSNAFHSFETTLFELSIHNTNLLVVPLGISNLRNGFNCIQR